MTIYRRNPLLMTVMGANPGRRRYRRNGIGEALVAGATSALVGRALQSNPGPSFIVVDAITGRVGYAKRAYGTGDDSIKRCRIAAEKIANRVGRPQLIFLALRSHVIGSAMSVEMIRAQGITDEVYPSKFGGFQPNPHLDGSPCPTCSGSLAYQGTLGDREHYRCRNCGLDFNTQITKRARYRGWKKTCAHGEITNRCRHCRGRKVSSRIKPCPHGISGGGVRCVACQRMFRSGGPVQNNPAISRSWDGLKGRQRMSILGFAGIPYEQAKYMASRPWSQLSPSVQYEVSKGWRDSSPSRGTTRIERRPMVPQSNPGPRGRRKMTITVEQFADWVKKKNDPKMWKAFLAKFRGYEKWTHGARARKVHLEWVDTPGVDGLWITYDGGKQPESTYIMPKGSPRKGAWKHPWDTMPDIKHDPQAGIVITKLRGQSKITDFYHK
jgi:hypothetical protein